MGVEAYFRSFQFASWPKRAWFVTTGALLLLVILCAGWFLYTVENPGNYMRFFALPAYAALAAVSIWQRLRWLLHETETARLSAEYSALFILGIPLLDVFDPESSMIEMELCGSFILLGLWCVVLDEFNNIYRGSNGRPVRFFHSSGAREAAASHPSASDQEHPAHP